MIGITADLTRFSEAEEKFNRRVPMTRADADALRRNAADQAFWISNVAEARVVQDVRDSLSRALRDGTPLEEWKKGIKEQLEEHWLSDHPTRLDTIFRNAAQTSYNRGRYLQMTHKAVLKTRPYWMLDTILDERTSSICRHLSSPKPVILPADHAFWATHIPPLHHRCRSGIRALRKADAEARGISKEAPAIDADGAFGNAPLGGIHRPEGGTEPEELPEQKPNKKPEPSPKQKPQIDDEFPVPTGLEPAVQTVFEKKTGRKKLFRQFAKDFKEDETWSYGVVKRLSDNVRTNSLPVLDMTLDAVRALPSEAQVMLASEPLDALVVLKEPYVTRTREGDLLGYYGWHDKIEEIKEGVLVVSTPLVDGKVVKELGIRNITVSTQLARTTAEAVRTVVTHEIGHALEHRMLRAMSDSDKEIWFLRRRLHRKAHGVNISRYAATKDEEYFAEAFATYVVFPEKLAAASPETFKLIEEFLLWIKQK